MMIALFDQEYAVKQYGNTMKQEGMAQGMTKVTQLMAKLFSLGKAEEAEKASKDPVYLQKLLKDYGLAEG